MNTFGDYLLTLLGQFAGGPGPPENNLVRFGLAAVLWSLLLWISLSRQRAQRLPRERLLVLGFALGLTRELFMLSQITERIVLGQESGLGGLHQPVEHTLAMVAIVAVAAAFLRYALDDRQLAHRFLVSGGLIAALALAAGVIVWPRQVTQNPQLHFHESWVAWLFHVALLSLIAIAILLLIRKRGWLTRVVVLALSLFAASEFIILLNYATDKSYNHVMCPVANSLHLLAIPVLGFVYLREQSIEKRQAEDALSRYREHLEELVSERTSELIDVNAQLRDEISEREEAERALETLSDRYEMILASAGEGICGLDTKGRYTFVNPAAAAMLGYEPEELIGEASHAVWLSYHGNGGDYEERESPIYEAYHCGTKHYGDGEFFWRRDGTSFPVRYFANPVKAHGALSGAVVVFQDITEEKQADIEIARRNARLAAQNAVASTVSQSLELNTILNDALDTVLSMQDLELGVILLKDPESGVVSPRAVRGCMSFQDLAKDEAAQEFLVQLAVDVVGDVPRLSHARWEVEQSDPPECLAQANIHSLLSVPLSAKGTTVGSLTVGSRHSDADQQPLIDQLTAIGQQIAMAVENARLYRVAEQSSAELDLLHRVSGKLAATLDPDTVSEVIAKQSLRLSGCSMAAMFRCSEGSKQCGLIAGHRLTRHEMEILQSTNARRMLEELVSEAQTIVSADVLTDPRIPRAWRRELGIRTALCLPIWRDTNTLEFLVLLDRAARSWTAEEVHLVERFGRRASVALTNAKFHQQAELSAALAERHRIAANMHDGLAQVLSYMNLKTDLALAQLESQDSQQALEELLLVQSAIDRASVDVRRSIASLQSDPEPRRSLHESLTRIAAEFAVEDEPTVHVHADTAASLYLGPDESEQVLRVVQEAILNARRHAQATDIAVSVSRPPSALRVLVEDNGCGFDLKSPSDNGAHFGLSIMQARAAHIDGVLEIESHVGQGTRVILTWPQADTTPEAAQQNSERFDAEGENPDRHNGHANDDNLQKAGLVTTL